MTTPFLTFQNLIYKNVKTKEQNYQVVRWKVTTLIHSSLVYIHNMFQTYLFKTKSHSQFLCCCKFNFFFSLKYSNTMPCLQLKFISVYIIQERHFWTKKLLRDLNLRIYLHKFCIIHSCLTRKTNFHQFTMFQTCYSVWHFFNSLPSSYWFCNHLER